MSHVPSMLRENELIIGMLASCDKRMQHNIHSALRLLYVRFQRSIKAHKNASGKDET